jgi:hypothetical protein
MKLSIKTILLFFCIFTQVTNAQFEDIYKDVAFNMPRVKETHFPQRTVKITDFGAQSGGIIKNTEAIE